MPAPVLRAMKQASIAGLMAIGLCVLLGTALEAVGTRPDTLNSALAPRARQPSTYVNARVLAANVAETETAPTFDSPVTGSTQRLVAVLSCSCSNYYVAATGTATVPAGDVTDGSASERNPAALDLIQGGSFSVVASEDGEFTVAYYLKSLGS